VRAHGQKYLANAKEEREERVKRMRSNARANRNVGMHMLGWSSYKAEGIWVKIVDMMREGCNKGRNRSQIYNDALEAILVQK